MQRLLTGDAMRASPCGGGEELQAAAMEEVEK